MKDEYANMFFDLHYEFIYFRHIEQGIRKYEKIYTNNLTLFSIISAISVWIRYYIPFLNFIPIVSSALTVVMIFVISKLSYSKQLIYLDLFNKESVDLINNIKTEKRSIEYNNFSDSKIKKLIDDFESRFRKLDKLYIAPLKLPSDGRLTTECQIKAAKENDSYFAKDYEKEMSRNAKKG